MLAIGGNLPSEIGDPIVTLKRAVLALTGVSSRVLQVSRFFKTPCFPAGAGPDFVNAALVVESDLDAEAMLTFLHEIEAEFGRTREKRWAGRTLDIDLIGGEDLVLPDRATYESWRDLSLDEQMREAPSQLILPHPRLQDRAFVLVPLNDVAADWIHPVSGLSVAEMLNNLPESDRKAVVPL